MDELWNTGTASKHLLGATSKDGNQSKIISLSSLLSDAARTHDGVGHATIAADLDTGAEEVDARATHFIHTTKEANEVHATPSAPHAATAPYASPALHAAPVPEVTTPALPLPNFDDVLKRIQRKVDAVVATTMASTMTAIEPTPPPRLDDDEDYIMEGEFESDEPDGATAYIDATAAVEPGPRPTSTSHAAATQQQQHPPTRHPCTEPGCEYTSTDFRTLNRHRVKHTGGRPYVCPVTGTIQYNPRQISISPCLGNDGTSSTRSTPQTPTSSTIQYNSGTTLRNDVTSSTPANTTNNYMFKLRILSRSDCHLHQTVNLAKVL